MSKPMTEGQTLLLIKSAQATSRKVANQNRRLLRRISQLVNNQKHYLRIRVPQLKGQNDYRRRVGGLIRLKQRLDRIIGPLHVWRDVKGVPRRWLLRLSLKERRRLFWILRRSRMRRPVELSRDKIALLNKVLRKARSKSNPSHREEVAV